MDAPVVFYYDFNSPYAYLAAERIGDLIPDAEWRPIAFAILLSKLGRLERALEQLDPAPVAAEIAERAGRLRGFSRAAYRKSFIESRSLAELDSVLAAAREVGLEPDEIRDGIERPKIKERLKGNTEQALARGVTGIPTVAVGDELFWGDDRLDEAAVAATRSG